MLMLTRKSHRIEAGLAHSPTPIIMEIAGKLKQNRMKSSHRQCERPKDANRRPEDGGVPIPCRHATPSPHGVVTTLISKIPANPHHRKVLCPTHQRHQLQPGNSIHGSYAPNPANLAPFQPPPNRFYSCRTSLRFPKAHRPKRQPTKRKPDPSPSESFSKPIP